MKKFWYACMLFTACLVGCTNTDDLKDDINDLDKRVTSLETQIKDLNGNIEAIRMLCEGGKTITTVNHANGVYTITLSDGTTLKLVEKTSTTALFPLVGINEDGCWQVSYDNGNTYQTILVNGKPVKAKGENGITPKFRIEKGYWQVSTDGKNYKNVLDEKGKPVQAVPSAGSAVEDAFFQKVENKGGTLDITLKDGTLVSVPIVKDFFCYFDKQYKGIQGIPANATREFNLHVKGAEIISVVAAPAGWLVEVAEPVAEIAKVKITAPAAAPKMRAVADNTKDVAILATKGANAQMAKIQVEIGEGGGEAPSPTVNDYYADYNAGKDIKIGNLTINKNSGYTAKQLDASAAEVDLSKEIHQLTKPTILFLKGTAHNFITKNVREVKVRTILVGQDKNQKVVLKPESYYKLTAGGLALKNITIDLTGFDGVAKNTGYFLSNGNATADAQWFIMEDCAFKGLQKPLYYAANEKNGINEIVVKNTTIECNLQDIKKNLQLFNIYKTEKLDAFSSFTFENNVVYNQTTIKGQIWAWDQNIIKTTTVTNDKAINLTVKNNTFVNFIGSNILHKLYKNANLTIQKNVFVGDKDKENDTKSSSIFCYYGEGAKGTINVDDNILFDQSIRKWTNYNSNTTLKNESVKNGLVSLKETPFATFDLAKGKFTMKAAYATYGAK